VPWWSTLRREVLRSADRVAELPVLRQDAILYGLSALFAAGESLFAVTADYREWGRVALVAYLAAALVCELAYRRRSRSGRLDLEQGSRASTLRRLVILAVLAAAVLAPLALQVRWRATDDQHVTNLHGAQAQPEVAVIERAGDRFARLEDPYLAHPTTVGISPSNDSRSVDASSYFPYLPGMAVFGLTNAAHVPRALRDARLPLAGFTLLVVGISLALSPSSSRRRWRTFQFLIVLPTGALPMVTGGDDLPVLALLLLGLVLVRRRQPVAAGIAMGFAGTLKWTAWPLIVLVLLCVRDRDGARAAGRYGLAVYLVSVPVILAGAAAGLHAFVVNVLKFPLGLTKIHSPAASPLPGQVLVQLFPEAKTQLTVALIAAGAVVVLTMLVRHPPRAPYAAAWFAGWALAFATFIAPATRFGYLIYPANMFVWAYLLHESSARHRLAPAGTDEREPVAAAQLASPTW
jgi:hypothetical protein